MDTTVKRAAFLTMLIALGTALVCAVFCDGAGVRMPIGAVLLAGGFLAVVFLLLIMPHS
jgi:hypothetical protein